MKEQSPRILVDPVSRTFVLGTSCAILQMLSPYSHSFGQLRIKFQHMMASMQSFLELIIAHSLAAMLSKYNVTG
jgi:hypothetical protein